MAGPAGGAHSGPPTPLAGERAPIGRRERREMKGGDKQGERNMYALPRKKILRAPMSTT